MPASSNHLRNTILRGWHRSTGGDIAMGREPVTSSPLLPENVKLGRNTRVLPSPPLLQTDTQTECWLLHGRLTMYDKWPIWRAKTGTIGFLMFSCGWAEFKYGRILAVQSRDSKLSLLKVQKNRISSIFGPRTCHLCHVLMSLAHSPAAIKWSGFRFLSYFLVHLVPGCTSLSVTASSGWFLCVVVCLHWSHCGGC